MWYKETDHRHGHILFAKNFIFLFSEKIWFKSLFSLDRSIYKVVRNILTYCRPHNTDIFSENWNVRKFSIFIQCVTCIRTVCYVYQYIVLHVFIQCVSCIYTVCYIYKYILSFNNTTTLFATWLIYSILAHICYILMI